MHSFEVTFDRPFHPMKLLTNAVFMKSLPNLDGIRGREGDLTQTFRLIPQEGVSEDTVRELLQQELTAMGYAIHAIRAIQG